jgi:protein-L-isoaspartate O-methyltransferase
MLQSLPKFLRHKLSGSFINPSSIVEGIDIKEGQKVLEIGNPFGYFAPALLNKVGHDGFVW